MDWDGICFNTATLIAGVFVLDYGADKFLDHTVIVGQRLGISPTLIALLTAGAEYEEVWIFLLIYVSSPGLTRVPSLPLLSPQLFKATALSPWAMWLDLPSPTSWVPSHWEFSSIQDR